MVEVDQIALVKQKTAREYLPVSDPVIRAALVTDLPDLYVVALKTGNSGSDATGMFLNDEMLGEVFVGAYVVHAPRTSFALSENGIPKGYGLCVLDTVQFQQTCQELWWPALQDKYRKLEKAHKRDWLIDEIFSPTPSPASVLEDFPSHGHIDLLPHVQGLGWGRKMMTHMENVLRELGSPGFHLRVSAFNDRGLRFYYALGYSELLRRGDEVVVGKVL